VVVMPSFEDTIEGNAGDVAGTIRAAAAIANRVFGDFVKTSDLTDPEHVKDFSAALATALADASDHLKLVVFSLSPVVQSIAVKATAAFLDGDLFTSMVRFLGDAQGSFGLSACCSLDRNVACIASRGQAMCLSFNAEVGAVLWGSESATQASARDMLTIVVALCIPSAPSRLSTEYNYYDVLFHRL
jgi:hypothetical protein